MVQGAIDAVIGNSALMTVLRQEVDRFNNLLHIMHKSLKSLVLAVKGEVIMSENLEEAYNALLSQKVPQRWKVSVPLIDPVSIDNIFMNSEIKDLTKGTLNFYVPFRLSLTLLAICLSVYPSICQSHFSFPDFSQSCLSLFYWNFEYCF